MSRRLRIQTLFCSIFFGLVSMTLLIYAATHKMIVTATAVEEDNLLEQEISYQTNQCLLKFEQSEKDTNYLIIPLPSGISMKQIEIENYYMNQRLAVFLDDVSLDFFQEHAISGNYSQILSGSAKEARGGICLEFSLSNIYECKSIMENGSLYLEFVSPRELYNQIVVIDAGHGGDDVGIESYEITEKEITLDIVKRLKELLDETNIKVYYTRLDDKNPSKEQRIYLANEVKADMFISLHLACEEDSEEYGTEVYYNSSFFIPGFGSVELGDLIEREVVTRINGKGRGIFPADDEHFEVQHASLPAIQLNVGYISNPQEKTLLQKKDYRQRIAEGIYDAIVMSYEE